MDGAKKQRSKKRRSDGATYGQRDGAKSEGAISLYIKIEKIKNKKSNCVGSNVWSERATEQQMDRATD